MQQESLQLASVRACGIVPVACGSPRHLIIGLKYFLSGADLDEQVGLLGINKGCLSPLFPALGQPGTQSADERGFVCQCI